MSIPSTYAERPREILATEYAEENRWRVVESRAFVEGVGLIDCLLVENVAIPLGDDREQAFDLAMRTMAEFWGIEDIDRKCGECYGTHFGGYGSFHAPMSCGACSDPTE